MAVTNRLRTIRETAAELGLSPNTVRLWISQGRMPHVRLGRTIRVPQSEIEQLMMTALFPPWSRAVRTPSWISQAKGSPMRPLQRPTGQVVNSPFARTRCST